MARGDSRALLEAIWSDRLPQSVSHDGQAACRSIGLATGSEVDRVIEHLSAQGLGAEPVGDPSAPSQRHAAAVRVDSAVDGVEGARLLSELGYRTWDPIEGPAEAIHRRFRSNLTLARTTDVTMVIDLQWGPVDGPIGRFPSALVPNENDYEAISLPALLWPLYFLLRPLRLVAERLGLRRRGTHQLGPFLGTPGSLIAPLLSTAAVTADDVLVDLGCGDGRVAIEAASSIGCRSIGVENNPALAEQARKQVAQAGPVGERVSIIEGDATAVDDIAGRGSVFFVFVPADAAVNLVCDLLEKAAPGSRILAHEQHRLLNEPPGAVTSAVISENAVTVAHCWTVA